MTNLLSEFVPVPMVDMTTIHFCSYCFKATDADNVHRGVCPMKELTKVFPEFWPPNWERLKCVDFKYNVCYVPGCEKPSASAKGKGLVKHLDTKHNLNLHLAAIGAGSKILESHPTTQANTLELPSYTDCVKGDSVIQPDSVLCAEEGSTKSTAIQGEERTVESEIAIALAAENHRETVKDSDVSSSSWKCQIFDTTDCKNPCGQPLSPPTTSLPYEVHKVEMIDCKDCLVDKIKCPTYTDAGDDLSASSSKKIRRNIQFTCGLCKFTSPKPHVIKKHYRQNHQTKLLYLCEPCFFVSHQKYTHQSHWKSYHPKDPLQLAKPIDLECLDSEDFDKPAQADATDSDIGELVIHNETNHDNYLLSEINLIVKCQFCSFKTGYSWHMRRHIASLHYTAICETLVNTADDTRKYRCNTCGTIAESKQAAANHYVSLHVDFPSVKCELCEVDIVGKAGFVQHLKTEMHREYYRRSLRCPNCQFATLSKKALQKHKASTHRILNSKMKEFACDKCKFVGVGMRQLNTHKKKVHGLVKDEDGLYKCDECEFKTPNKDKLLSHSKNAPDHSVAKKCVRCDFCDFAALNLSGLNYHKRMIHGTGS